MKAQALPTWFTDAQHRQWELDTDFKLTLPEAYDRSFIMENVMFIAGAGFNWLDVYEYALGLLMQGTNPKDVIEQTIVHYVGEMAYRASMDASE